uniref:ATP-dependent RNA helicase DeaD n=1 Tax=Chlorobium chlorochromatii (strain CaD3) TaxID=340177 RepID=Q3ARJ7_CHLCH
MSEQQLPLENNFFSLQLPELLMKALEEVGYESPTPIQAQTIPFLLAGRDVLGQAQTGTGKTAAFALPILASIDIQQAEPQALVLAPTRELAIQVAEAFQRYAEYLKGFHVVPIYGGQDYGIQFRMLRRGVQVVVGTPGRVMDHIRRGSLNLTHLKTLVLDEADEMLRMGFIDDVEWILEQTPAGRQVALFSATMPPPIRRIAQKYLDQPAEVTIQTKTTTVDTIRQRYWVVGGSHKLDILTRILEVEPFDGMIIFSRTKTMTIELAEKLQARGYAAAALNGDMPQNQRERTIEQLKNGNINIVVATDVAARGLDVERISHVVNYDIPSDTESYVHRIGRTGRAGRAGDAILFVAPREKNMLYAIEKATRSRIEQMVLPTTEVINNKRIAKFNQRISDTIAAEDLGFFTRMIEQYCNEHNVPMLDAAAALASLVQGETPLLLADKPERSRSSERDSYGSSRDRGFEREGRDSRSGGREGRSDRFERDGRSGRDDRGGRDERSAPRKRGRSEVYGEEPKDRYRLEVGSTHGVKAGNILGAILNEAGLAPESVGHISISDTYTTIELPKQMPDTMFHELRKIRVCGRQLRLSRMEEHEGGHSTHSSHGTGAYGGGAKKSFRKPNKSANDEGEFFAGFKKKRKG